MTGKLNQINHLWYIAPKQWPSTNRSLLIRKTLYENVAPERALKPNLYVTCFKFMSYSCSRAHDVF